MLLLLLLHFSFHVFYFFFLYVNVRILFLFLKIFMIIFRSFILEILKSVSIYILFIRHISLLTISFSYLLILWRHLSLFFKIFVRIICFLYKLIVMLNNLKSKILIVLQISLFIISLLKFYIKIFFFFRDSYRWTLFWSQMALDILMNPMNLMILMIQLISLKNSLINRKIINFLNVMLLSNF